MISTSISNKQRLLTIGVVVNSFILTGVSRLPIMAESFIASGPWFWCNKTNLLYPTLHVRE